MSAHEKVLDEVFNILTLTEERQEREMPPLSSRILILIRQVIVQPRWLLQLKKTILSGFALLLIKKSTEEHKSALDSLLGNSTRSWFMMVFAILVWRSMRVRLH